MKKASSYHEFVKKMMANKPSHVKSSDYMKTIAHQWKAHKKGGLVGYNYDSGYYNNNNCGDNMLVKCAPPPPRSKIVQPESVAIGAGFRRYVSSRAEILLPPYDNLNSKLAL
jgi:hypothetical protein